MKIAFLLLSLISLNVFAKCENAENTIFSCLTAKAKQIEVCDSGKNISYSFGYPNEKPEIVVMAPRGKVTKENFIGTGCITSSVNIPNGNTTYKVYAVEDGRQSLCENAGVEVIVNKNSSAIVKCKNPENIINNIDGAELLQAEYN